MAAKKTTALTAGERLEKALVPAAEQPYEVPENWCWTKIGTVANLYRGVSYKKHEGHSKKGKDDCLVMRGGNIKEGEIDISAENIYISKELITDEQYIKKHDIIIVTSTGSTKVIGRAGISFADYDDVAFGAFLTLVRPVEAVHKPYVSYYFQGEMYRNRMRQLASGVNINNIRNEYITDTPIPLAPLAEQKRIVATIEGLFADLDRATENAERIVKQHDERRANLLHSAITGELTEMWRQAHGVGIDDWTSSSIDGLCYSLKYGTAKKSKNSGPVVVLRMGNMQEGEIDWTDLAYTDDADDIAKYHLEPGDVLFNRTNSATHVGKTSIYRGEYPAIYAGYLIKLDYDHSRVIGNYLTYALNTPTAREYCQSVKTDGVNQSNINARKIGAFTIPLPSIEEQAEIIRILDELLADEQRIKEAAEETLAKIDLMKKSILADAFRGKLGTNDPSDQPATELLKQILA